MSDSSLIPPRAPIAPEGQGSSLSWRNGLAFLQRHPLLTFFVLAFGIEWILSLLTFVCMDCGFRLH